MRENRTYGSEGGGAGNSTGSSYPYFLTAPLGLTTGARSSSACPTNARATMMVLRVMAVQPDSRIPSRRRRCSR